MKNVLCVLVILMISSLCVSAQQTDSPLLQDMRMMIASEVYNDPAAKALYNEKYNKRYNNSDAANIAGQTLQFALTFPAISADDKVVVLIVPSSTWKFKNLVCK